MTDQETRALISETIEATVERLKAAGLLQQTKRSAREKQQKRTYSSEPLIKKTNAAFLPALFTV